LDVLLELQLLIELYLQGFVEVSDFFIVFFELNNARLYVGNLFLRVMVLQLFLFKCFLESLDLLDGDMLVIECPVYAFSCLNDSCLQMRYILSQLSFHKVLLLRKFLLQTLHPTFVANLVSDHRLACWVE